MSGKRALITDITGQDGCYLAELLLGKGYEVYGLERKKTLEDQEVKRQNNAQIIPCDISSYSSVFDAVQRVMPKEVYHLAAQSDVYYSFKEPFETLEVNRNGTSNVLQAIKQLVPESRMYFAGSSEMFGEVTEEPQNEQTVFAPRSP